MSKFINNLFVNKRIYNLWPALLIFGTWFIFSYPYFINRFVPYPAKYQVTFFHPWSMYEKWRGPVKNNAMPDVITQIYPWKYYSIQTLKSGQLPFWNPYSFAGNPHIGNFQSAVFSPFNLLFLILPFIDAWSIQVLIQPLLAGIFTYIYTRQMKVSKAGAVLSSITYMFCGFIVVWMAYGTLSMAAVFLPFALYGIEKGINTGKNRFFLILSISLILSYFSGHIQTSFYITLFSFFYFTYKSFKLKSSKNFIRIFLFFLLGLTIALIQIYPTYKLLKLSPRNSSFYSGGGIPLDHLITIIAPDFFGNPVTRNDWVGNYAEWSGFIGVIPLVLAIIAFWAKRRNPVTFFSIAGIAALLLSLDTPLNLLLVFSKIPILATSIPSRIILLCTFSLAILAGFGFDSFMLLLKQNKYSKVITITLVLLLLLLSTAAAIHLGKLLPLDKAYIAIRNLIIPCFLLMILIFILFINKFFSNKLIYILTIIVILLISSLDSLRFVSKWTPFDRREYVYPAVPVLKAMQEKIGYGRVFGNIGTEVTNYYGISSVEGYDPLYINRYGEFVRYASTGAWQNAERSVAHFDRRSKFTQRALDLLGVSLIYHPLADTYTSWAFPVWENSSKYSVIYQDDKFQLYKNNSALPRVKLYSEFEVINDNKKILNELFKNEFDITKKIILEKIPDNFTSYSAEAGDMNSEIVSYTANKIVIKAKTRNPALLFVSDNYYPAWKAYINGKKTEIFRTNYTFRSVLVPAGESKIEFVYKEYI